MPETYTRRYSRLDAEMTHQLHQAFQTTVQEGIRVDRRLNVHEMSMLKALNLGKCNSVSDVGRNIRKVCVTKDDLRVLVNSLGISHNFNNDVLFGRHVDSIANTIYRGRAVLLSQITKAIDHVFTHDVVAVNGKLIVRAHDIIEAVSQARKAIAPLRLTFISLSEPDQVTAITEEGFDEPIQVYAVMVSMNMVLERKDPFKQATTVCSLLGGIPLQSFTVSPPEPIEIRTGSNVEQQESDEEDTVEDDDE